MADPSPARLYALLLGAVLTVAGIAGFFYVGSFDTGDVVPTESLLGVFEVNGWHNVLHLLTGLLGLTAAGSGLAARTYALGLGLLYLAIAIWGFVLGDGGVILDLVPVNTEDNVLHLLLGLLGLGAFAATPGKPRSSD